VSSTITADAGSNQTVFYGYSPMASATLAASGSGGSGSYSYSWNTGATTQSITVSPTSTTTYTVTVTDGNGCTATDEVKVKVVDVRCGNKNDKVNVCHNGNQICVDASAVPAHLNHGCSLGPCPLGAIYIGGEEENHGLEVSVYPNPSNGLFTLQLDMHEQEQVKITVTNIMGQQVAVIADEILLAGTFNVDLTTEAAGVYMLNIQTAHENIVKRIVVNR
jgi:VCBS repeat-containing protein